MRVLRLLRQTYTHYYVNTFVRSCQINICINRPFCGLPGAHLLGVLVLRPKRLTRNGTAYGHPYAIG